MRDVKSVPSHGLRRCVVLAIAAAAVGLLLAPAGELRADEHGATLAGKHVAFLVGEGVQDAEALVPLGYLVNRGAKVTVVGSAVGLKKAYNSDFHVRVEKTVGEVSPDDFDGLVIPGGRSPANLREDEAVVDFARAIAKAGKPVAAICHGPQVLAAAGVLDGKKATCVASIADELRQAGAHYADEAMIRDGNLITSRLPKDLPDFCAAIEKALREK